MKGFTELDVIRRKIYDINKNQNDISKVDLALYNITETMSPEEVLLRQVNNTLMELRYLSSFKLEKFSSVEYARVIELSEKLETSLNEISKSKIPNDVAPIILSELENARKSAFLKNPPRSLRRASNRLDATLQLARIQAADQMGDKIKTGESTQDLKDKIQKNSTTFFGRLFSRIVMYFDSRSKNSTKGVPLSKAENYISKSYEKFKKEDDDKLEAARIAAEEETKKSALKTSVEKGAAKVKDTLSHLGATIAGSKVVTKLTDALHIPTADEKKDKKTKQRRTELTKLKVRKQIVPKQHKDLSTVIPKDIKKIKAEEIKKAEEMRAEETEKQRKIDKQQKDAEAAAKLKEYEETLQKKKSQPEDKPTETSKEKVVVSTETPVVTGSTTADTSAQVVSTKPPEAVVLATSKDTKQQFENLKTLKSGKKGTKMPVETPVVAEKPVEPAKKVEGASQDVAREVPPKDKGELNESDKSSAAVVVEPTSTPKKDETITAKPEKIRPAKFERTTGDRNLKAKLEAPPVSGMVEEKVPPKSEINDLTEEFEKSEVALTKKRGFFSPKAKKQKAQPSEELAEDKTTNAEKSVGKKPFWKK